MEAIKIDNTKVINIKNTAIQLKKDYLTYDEVTQIVKIALEVYQEDTDIEGYGYSPISMHANFYALLFYYCIEDYELGSTDDFNKYYNLGVHQWLLKEITNADEAYRLMESTAMELVSLEQVVNTNLQQLVGKITEKLPNPGELQDLVNKLPKEWQKAVNDYSQITGQNIQEGDV